MQSSGEHPAADWVYQKLIKEFPDLSMGTVYRNLKILVEQDLIKKIDFGSTFDRFDANITQHYHFICENCNAIFDLELPVDEELNKRVNKASPFTARRHRIEFYGTCNQCKEKVTK